VQQVRYAVPVYAINDHVVHNLKNQNSCRRRLQESQKRRGRIYLAVSTGHSNLTGGGGAFRLAPVGYGPCFVKHPNIRPSFYVCFELWYGIVSSLLIRILMTGRRLLAWKLLTHVSLYAPLRCAGLPQTIMLCYVPCYCSLELTLRCMRVGGRRVGAAYMGW